MFCSPIDQWLEYVVEGKVNLNMVVFPSGHRKGTLDVMSHAMKRTCSCPLEKWLENVQILAANQYITIVLLVGELSKIISHMHILPAFGFVVDVSNLESCLL